ncbi:MAG: outer membrane beta-barrel protein [Candidatus Omnitrophica bacterium]|nr:outer membrane beta-barrel protein [Candidatus Omnitrophota bacterium]
MNNHKTYARAKLWIVLALYSVFTFGAVSILWADENVDERVVAEVVKYWEAAHKKEARVKALVQADMMAARTPTETAVIETIKFQRKRTKEDRKKEIQGLRRSRLAGRKGVREPVKRVGKRTLADRIQLGYLFQTTYDDNVFLAPKKHNTRKDVILETTPTIAADLGFGNVDLDVAYIGDWYYYVEQWKQRRYDQSIQAHSAVPVFKNLLISGDYQHVRAASRASSETTNFSPFIENVFDGGFNYDLGRKFAVGGEYKYRQFHYTDSSQRGNNWFYHRFIPTFYYKYSPKTSFFAQFMLGKTNGGRQRFQSDDWHISAGVKGRLSSKMVAYVNFGILRRKFEISKPNLTTPMLKAVVVWGMTPRDTLAFTSSWDSEQSASDANFYVSLNAFANWKHDLTKKLSTTLMVGGRRNIYPDLTFDPRNIPGARSAKRRDNFLNTKGGIRYNLKDWIYLDISYRYNLRDSNFDSHDYQENEFVGGIGGEF